jgi:hypothetical protein
MKKATATPKMGDCRLCFVCFYIGDVFVGLIPFSKSGSRKGILYIP